MRFMRPEYTIQASGPVTIGVSESDGPVVSGSYSNITVWRSDIIGRFFGSNSRVSISGSASVAAGGSIIKGKISIRVTGDKTPSSGTVQLPRGSRVKLMRGTLATLTREAVTAGISLK